MQVVLLERVAKLGQMGEVVQVRDGYARNFLLPQGKALRATEANLKRFETDRAQLEARNLEAKKEAEKVAAPPRRPDLRGHPLRLRRRRALRLGDHPRHRRRGDRRRLLASTAARWSSTSRSRSSACTRSRSRCTPRSTRPSGSTSRASIEEAELQATGRTIQELQAEAEAAAEFDIQELFDDIGGAVDETGPLPTR